MSPDAVGICTVMRFAEGLSEIVMVIAFQSFHVRRRGAHRCRNARHHYDRPDGKDMQLRSQRWAEQSTDCYVLAPTALGFMARGVECAQASDSETEVWRACQKSVI